MLHEGHENETNKTILGSPSRIPLYQRSAHVPGDSSRYYDHHANCNGIGNSTVTPIMKKKTSVNGFSTPSSKVPLHKNNYMRATESSNPKSSANASYTTPNAKQHTPQSIMQLNLSGGVIGKDNYANSTISPLVHASPSRLSLEKKRELQTGGSSSSYGSNGSSSGGGVLVDTEKDKRGKKNGNQEELRLQAQASKNQESSGNGTVGVKPRSSSSQINGTIGSSVCSVSKTAIAKRKPTVSNSANVSVDRGTKVDSVTATPPRLSKKTNPPVTTRKNSSGSLTRTVTGNSNKRGGSVIVAASYTTNSTKLHTPTSGLRRATASSGSKGTHINGSHSGPTTPRSASAHNTPRATKTTSMPSSAPVDDPYASAELSNTKEYCVTESLLYHTPDRKPRPTSVAPAVSNSNTTRVSQRTQTGTHSNLRTPPRATNQYSHQHAPFSAMHPSSSPSTKVHSVKCGGNVGVNSGGSSVHPTNNSGSGVPGLTDKQHQLKSQIEKSQSKLNKFGQTHGCKATTHTGAVTVTGTGVNVTSNSSSHPSASSVKRVPSHTISGNVASGIHKSNAKPIVIKKGHPYFRQQQYAVQPKKPPSTSSQNANSNPLASNVHTHTPLKTNGTVNATNTNGCRGNSTTNANRKMSANTSTTLSTLMHQQRVRKSGIATGSSAATGSRSNTVGGGNEVVGRTNNANVAHNGAKTPISTSGGGMNTGKAIGTGGNATAVATGVPRDSSKVVENVVLKKEKQEMERAPQPRMEASTNAFRTGVAHTDLPAPPPPPPIQHDWDVNSNPISNVVRPIPTPRSSLSLALTMSPCSAFSTQKSIKRTNEKEEEGKENNFVPVAPVKHSFEPAQGVDTCALAVLDVDVEPDANTETKRHSHGFGVMGVPCNSNHERTGGSPRLHSPRMLVDNGHETPNSSNHQYVNLEACILPVKDTTVKPGTISELTIKNISVRDSEQNFDVNNRGNQAVRERSGSVVTVITENSNTSAGMSVLSTIYPTNGSEMHSGLGYLSDMSMMDLHNISISPRSVLSTPLTTPINTAMSTVPGLGLHNAPVNVNVYGMGNNVHAMTAPPTPTPIHGPMQLPAPVLQRGFSVCSNIEGDNNLPSGGSGAYSNVHTVDAGDFMFSPRPDGKGSSTHRLMGSQYSVKDPCAESPRDGNEDLLSNIVDVLSRQFSDANLPGKQHSIGDHSNMHAGHSGGGNDFQVKSMEASSSACTDRSQSHHVENTPMDSSSASNADRMALDTSNGDSNSFGSMNSSNMHLLSIPSGSNAPLCHTTSVPTVHTVPYNHNAAHVLQPAMANNYSTNNTMIENSDPTGISAESVNPSPAFSDTSEFASVPGSVLSYNSMNPNNIAMIFSDNEEDYQLATPSGPSGLFSPYEEVDSVASNAQSRCDSDNHSHLMPLTGREEESSAVVGYDEPVGDVNDLTHAVDNGKPMHMPVEGITAEKHAELSMGSVDSTADSNNVSGNTVIQEARLKAGATDCAADAGEHPCSFLNNSTSSYSMTEDDDVVSFEYEEEDSIYQDDANVVVGMNENGSLESVSGISSIRPSVSAHSSSNLNLTSNTNNLTDMTLTTSSCVPNSMSSIYANGTGYSMHTMLSGVSNPTSTMDTNVTLDCSHSGIQHNNTSDDYSESSNAEVLTKALFQNSDDGSEGSDSCVSGSHEKATGLTDSIEISINGMDRKDDNSFPPVHVSVSNSSYEVGDETNIQDLGFLGESTINKSLSQCESVCNQPSNNQSNSQLHMLGALESSINSSTTIPSITENDHSQLDIDSDVEIDMHGIPTEREDSDPLAQSLEDVF